MPKAQHRVGAYREPNITHMLRTHAHALCPDPADAEALVAQTLALAPALSPGEAEAPNEQTRIALLSLLYRKWRGLQVDAVSRRR